MRVGKALISAPIKELCEMVKGQSPTMKTPPGDYPLVVTAANRRTSDQFQLVGPAVCVPLISSTGHGHASMHRVHYQEGKFALADLLVALLPKDSEQLNCKYLYWLLTAKKDEYFLPLMQGTANVSLKIRDIESVVLSVPSLAEQGRIVAKIERVEGKVAEAQRLRTAIADDQGKMLRSLLFNNGNAACTDTSMSELVQLRKPDVEVLGQESYEFAGIYSFGRGIFRGQTKQGVETSYKRLTRLQAYNFVYPKLMAWEGAFAIVPPEYEGCVVSTEFPVFAVKTDRVLPEVLAIHFSDPATWAKVSGQSTGTNVRRRRLHPDDLLRYRFPLPPWEIQEKFRHVHARIAEASQLQVQVTAELDGLLPAVLDRAFRGEL